MVGAVGFDGAVNKAVGGCIERFLFCIKGRLEHAVHLFVVLEGCSLQETFGRGVTFFATAGYICVMRSRVGCDWHFVCVL